MGAPRWIFPLHLSIAPSARPDRLAACTLLQVFDVTRTGFETSLSILVARDLSHYASQPVSIFIRKYNQPNKHTLKLPSETLYLCSKTFCNEGPSFCWKFSISFSISLNSSSHNRGRKTSNILQMKLEVWTTFRLTANTDEYCSLQTYWRIDFKCHQLLTLRADFRAIFNSSNTSTGHSNGLSAILCHRKQT